jgi:hypothetical protein
MLTTKGDTMPGKERMQPLQGHGQVGFERTSDRKQRDVVLEEMLPQIREILALAAKGGFRVPVAFILGGQEKHELRSRFAEKVGRDATLDRTEDTEIGDVSRGSSQRPMSTHVAD